MSSIPVLAGNAVIEALDEVTYGSHLNKQFVKAAEEGNTGAMIAALVDGADVDQPEGLTCGYMAFHRAKENGHRETASVLRSYLEHREANKPAP